MTNRRKAGTPSRKKPGKGMQDHSELLAQIVDFLPDPTFAIDREGRVILWNRAMEDFTRVKAETILGKSGYEHAVAFYGMRRPMLVDLVFRPDEDIEKEYDLIRRERGTLIAEGPVEIRGMRRYIWGKASPIHDTQGAVIGAIESVRDITERRKTEDALQRSEARYRDIFLNVSDLLYLHDLDGNFIETNLASKKETGYTEGDLEHLRIHDILPERHRHRFRNYISNVVKNGSDEGFLTIRTKTGDERILEYRNSLVTDPDGKPVAVRGSARDITARIKAQKQLRRERDLITSIIETSPAFFDAVDPRGRTIMMNQAMLRALGYTEDEVLGSDYRKTFIPEEHGRIFSAALEELVTSGRPVVHENKVLAKDGRELLVQWSSRAVFSSDGTLEFIFGIGIDITEHKKAEQDLKKSEENYRKIFENATEGIYQTTPEGRYLSVNPSFARMFGYTSPEEMIASVKNIGDELYVHREDREYMVETLGKHDRLEGYEVEVYRKDRSRFWISINIHTVRDAAGNILYFEGTNVDITERKKAEEEHRIYEARLARSQKLEAIGTLAGGIAHDFNNILSAIIGYSELAMEDLPEESAARESIAEVLTAGDRAKELVRQILTFSRQMETERKPVRVQIIVKEALKLLRSSIPRTITIEEHIDKTAGPVMADPTQIHQVIMNLCTNAYQAMMPTGGVMTVSVDSSYVDGHFASLHPELSEGAFVKLTVQDTGTGMDADTVKRIFDPFFTTKEKTKGTGLGLSTVHGIIADMKGTVVVSSNVGAGSTFEVYMPVTATTDDLEEEPDTDLAKGKGETILLVDDEEAILHFTSVMLEQLGYRVVKTSSSLEALRIFQLAPGKIDLVITDQTMPGMTGADLAAEILKVRPSMPVILMTGFSEVISPEEALARGIEEYLEKPFTRSAIASAVQRCLR